MRELRVEGKVVVKLVPTALNGADMFTKPLDRQTFHTHRATVMNLHAAPTYADALVDGLQPSTGGGIEQNDSLGQRSCRLTTNS